MEIVDSEGRNNKPIKNQDGVIIFGNSILMQNYLDKKLREQCAVNYTGCAVLYEKWLYRAIEKYYKIHFGYSHQKRQEINNLFKNIFKSYDYAALYRALGHPTVAVEYPNSITYERINYNAETYKVNGRSYNPTWLIPYKDVMIIIMYKSERLDIYMKVDSFYSNQVATNKYTNALVYLMKLLFKTEPDNDTFKSAYSALSKSPLCELSGLFKEGNQ